jgi:diguanylate cyclase (GGDEF)-like protein
MGGDEFAIILERTTEAEAARVAGRIQEALASPLRVHEQQIGVSASVGIAVASADARDTDGLVERADLAMYSAKQRTPR